MVSKIVDEKEAYENLANAIIVSAAEDYRTVLRVLKKHPDNERLRNDARKLEAFFESEWYGLLTEVDGSYLIRKLREEAAYECDVEIPG